VAGANWVRQIVESEKPARTFVDVGGVGGGVVDLLNSAGAFPSIVAVNFGSEPQDEVIILPDGSKKPGGRNRRAEMWMRSRDWLKEVGGADIPDSDALQADACGPAYKYDANQRLQLESKEDMRRRGLRSPDEWDAVVLTFAEPVIETSRSNSAIAQEAVHGWEARRRSAREARERYAAGVDADRLNRLRDQQDRKFYTGGDEPVGVGRQEHRRSQAQGWTPGRFLQPAASVR
jgi:hypothetical protein